MSSIDPVVSEEKMLENVDGRTSDTRVTGILIAHLGAFGSGELKMERTGFLIFILTLTSHFTFSYIFIL